MFKVLDIYTINKDLDLVCVECVDLVMFAEPESKNINTISKPFNRLKLAQTGSNPFKFLASHNIVSK